MDSISLMYHCIYASIPQESGFQGAGAMIYKISSVDFEKQVNAISKYLEKNNLEKEAVTFTFDDGGVSFITIIAPILERYGYRGLFFISTRYIGTEGFLTVDQIKELVTRGHMVGSHSHTHPEMMNTMKEEDLIYECKNSGDIFREIIGKKFGFLMFGRLSIFYSFFSLSLMSGMLTSAFPWNQDLPPSNPSILTSIESVSNDPFSGPSISLAIMRTMPIGESSNFIS